MHYNLKFKKQFSYKGKLKDQISRIADLEGLKT